MRLSVLVTGSNGFVGQNLIPFLSKKNFKVQSLGRSNLSKDLCIRDTHAIVHLAGKAHDMRAVDNPCEYYKANFELTKKIFDAFLVSDAKIFIFISSVKAVSDSVDGVLYENELAQPLTHYGKSKLMAEEYIMGHQLSNGKYYYILRPCMIHGPGNKGNLNLLYRFIEMGIPYPLAAYKNKRSFLSISNLCFVIDKLLTENVISGIYNVADDDALSTNEVVKILATVTGKRTLLCHIPKIIINALAKLGDILYLPLNTERLNKLTENYIVSNNKLKQALNAELPLTTKQGLEITAGSFINK